MVVDEPYVVDSCKGVDAAAGQVRMRGEETDEVVAVADKEERHHSAFQKKVVAVAAAVADKD